MYFLIQFSYFLGFSRKVLGKFIRVHTPTQFIIGWNLSVFLLLPNPIVTYYQVADLQLYYLNKRGCWDGYMSVCNLDMPTDNIDEVLKGNFNFF